MSSRLIIKCSDFSSPRSTERRVACRCVHLQRPIVRKLQRGISTQLTKSLRGNQSQRNSKQASKRAAQRSKQAITGRLLTVTEKRVAERSSRERQRQRRRRRMRSLRAAPLSAQQPNRLADSEWNTNLRISDHSKPSAKLVSTGVRNESQQSQGESKET